MDNAAQNSQNVQDSFLNTLRRDRINVTIYLMGGVKLTGKIKSFDKFSLVLESGNLEQLIFKHAISTISVPRGAVHHPRPEIGREQQQERAQAAQTPAPAGPSASGGSSSATSSS